MEQIRAVLVEDDLNTCALMDAYFQSHRQVRLCGMAHDGDRGLALIRSIEPDLVLLDLVMPRRSGVGVLDALQEDPPRKPPKIIVLSQVSNEETIRGVLARKVSYYLMKPVNFSEIIRVIHLLFGGTCVPQDLARRAEQRLLEMYAEEGALGFRYAAAAAEALAAYTGTRKMLLKEAYHPVIKADHTNYACVEKNIRATVRRIHTAETDAYRALMGSLPDVPPANGDFLRRLANLLRAELHNSG